MEGLPEEAVSFLYKTMIERDPQKRRVKPVQHHLLQLDFAGLDDSSDDSDFQVDDVKESDDDDIDEAVSSGETGDESSEEMTRLEEDKNKKDPTSGASEVTKLSNWESNSLLPGASVESSKISGSVGLSDTGSVSLNSSHTGPKVLICCVCLREYSEEDNEIVECDSCGVAVHEGCYGISDSQSVASTVSSASTEPWFCDACKAGVKPHCELCPNSGGIYKETDNSRWVHLVCALYIPGIAFGDVDKLSPVTLFEMSYSKWGAKECSLCTDDNFSSTGVCICCDAGMCRTYFHVTCAQREGLLSETSPDEEIADPFYAYCKQHADKMRARIKHRNYLVIQSESKKGKDWSTLDDKERTRVQRKLNRHRHKYQLAKAKRPPCWQPTEKVPRMLFSSPSATRKLMRKAQLLGIHTQTQTTSIKDIRKKWHLPPAFSTEFVSYYFDRQERMTEMRKHNRDLLEEREKLQKEGSLLRVKYDQILAGHEEIKETGNTLLKQVEAIYTQLNDFVDKPFVVPASLYPKQPTKMIIKKEEAKSPPLSSVIHQCGVCHKTNSQHLLARCDTCKLFYHLGCLNPPLTRMPKKTRQMGWQCSECVGSASNDSDDPDIDPDAPRRLREKIKEPMKFTPSSCRMKVRRRSEVTRGLARRGSAVKRKKPSSPTKPTTSHVTQEQTTKAVNKSPEISLVSTDTACSTKRPTRNVKQQQQKSIECSVCMKLGDITNTVKCDGCTLNYHFQCLDPPQSKSPRYRGYAWFCTACQSSPDNAVTNTDWTCQETPHNNEGNHVKSGRKQPISSDPLESHHSVTVEKKNIRKKDMKNRGKIVAKALDETSMLHQMLTSGSPFQPSLMVVVKCDVKDASSDTSHDVIVLDDDDDDDDGGGGDGDDKADKIQKVDSKEKLKSQRCSPGSKVMAPVPGKGSSGGHGSEGSEAATSPRCGLPSRIKRPMILSKSSKTKNVADGSSSKRQKIDFA